MHLEEFMDSIERERILAALEQTRLNKTAAAKLLGISFRALRYRLQKYALEERGTPDDESASTGS